MESIPEMTPGACDIARLSVDGLCPSLEMEKEQAWECPSDRPAPIRGMYRQSSPQAEPRQFAKRQSSVDVVKVTFVPSFPHFPSTCEMTDGIIWSNDI